MQKLLEPLIENLYSVSNPMPVVSISELNIELEKDGVYLGAFEIINSAEGTLMGIVESIYNYITFKERTVLGNKLAITYSIDANCLCANDNVEDLIIFTYNGGEICIPVCIKIKEIAKEIKIKSRPQTISKDIKIICNKRNYQPDEKGYLIIKNPNQHKILVRIINEESCIVFNHSELEVIGEEKLEFSFKISKLDRLLGKIPLKINPEYPIKVQLAIHNQNSMTVIPIAITLTEMDVFETKDVLTSEREYVQLICEISRLYQEKTLNDINYYDELVRKMKSAIQYNRTDITLRLMFCYLLLSQNNKKMAKQEINNIDRYLLYYDKINTDISDILMLFLGLLKGEQHIDSLIRTWKPKVKDNWLKILLKNRMLIHNGSCYDDYKALYHMGAKNVFVFTEAANFLNHNPFIPFEEDLFYKALIKWTLNHHAVSSKWLKKLELNSQQLSRHNLIDEDSAQKLYTLNDSKSMLILLATVYLQVERIDSIALKVYRKILAEKAILPTIELYYVKASYHCMESICLEYFRMNFTVNTLEEPYRSFFLLNLIINKSQFKTLYHINESAILELDPVKLPEGIELKVEAKIAYIEYLLKQNKIEWILQLDEKEWLEQLPKDLVLILTNSVIKNHPIEGIQLALKIYIQKGYYDADNLKLMGDYYKGKLMDLIAFYHLQLTFGFVSDKLEEEILYKGIMTKRYPQEIIKIFINHCKSNTQAANQLWLLKYLIAQVLIEDFEPTPQMLGILRHAYNKNSELSTGLALLKGMLKSVHKDENLIIGLVTEYVDQGILFPWFELLIPGIQLGETFRLKQCFEYHCKQGRSVNFYYRIDEQEEFTCVQMKHVVLGLYLVYVVIFYNETLQYYIEECEGDTFDIKLSDVFKKDDSVEQDEIESLFDTINTAKMCIELNDENSLEQTIEEYFKNYKREIKKFVIL